MAGPFKLERVRRTDAARQCPYRIVPIPSRCNAPRRSRFCWHAAPVWIIFDRLAKHARLPSTLTDSPETEDAQRCSGLAELPAAVVVAILVARAAARASLPHRHGAAGRACAKRRPASRAGRRPRSSSRPRRPSTTGTLVVRDGVIVAVGEKVDVARRRPQSGTPAGKTLYPGLIDAYGELSAEASAIGRQRRGRRRLLEREHRAADSGRSRSMRPTRARTRNSARKASPPGSSPRRPASSRAPAPWSARATAPASEVILKDQVALHLKLTVARGSRGYPNSPMGAYTLVRQAMLRRRLVRPGLGRLRAASRTCRAPSEATRWPCCATTRARAAGDHRRRRRTVFPAGRSRSPTSSTLDAIVRGSGNEYRRLEAVKATGRAVIVPVDFPKPPNVATPEAAMNVVARAADALGSGARESRPGWPPPA